MIHMDTVGMRWGLAKRKERGVARWAKLSS